MSEILRLILPFFGILFLGYGAGRMRRVSEDGLAGLTFFVTYLAMPALFFRLVAEAPLNHPAAWSFVLTTTSSTYCAFAIAFSIGALTNGGQMIQATIQGLVGSYSNVGMLAAALVLPAFGTAAALPMALVYSFDNALLVASIPLMMTLGGTMNADPAELAQRILRQALLNPLVLATILGLVFALSGLEMPAVADSILSMLGGAAAPAALFAVGVSLAGQNVDKVPPELPLLIGIKLAAHPLIVYLLLSWVGDFDPVWVRAAVLMAALPPATSAIAYARQYKSYAEWASAGVLLGTIISIATLTVVLIMLVKDVVPADPFP
jgi:malonate transporter